MMPVQVLSPLSPPTALHQAASQLGQAWAGGHAQELAAGAPIRFAGEQQPKCKAICVGRPCVHVCILATANFVAG